MAATRCAGIGLKISASNAGRSACALQRGAHCANTSRVRTIHRGPGRWQRSGLASGQTDCAKLCKERGPGGPRTEMSAAWRTEMLSHACSNETRPGRRSERRHPASALAVAVGLTLALAAAASSHRPAPAYAGTWKCVDAVDNNDRPFSIVIRRVGKAFELDDPSQTPSRTDGGRLKGGRLTFRHKERTGSSPVVFTMAGRGGRLTEEYVSAGSHLAIHFVRVSRPMPPRHPRRHPGQRSSH